MEIRTSFGPEEIVDDHIRDLRPVAVFLTECVGLVLHKEKGCKNNVMFTTLTEDDLFWSIGHPYGYSSYFLRGLNEVTAEAIKWCNINADRGQYGWTFKA